MSVEQISYPVVNSTGKQVGEVALDTRVFGVTPREDVVHAAIVWQRNAARAGTHSTLRKGVMRGGGRKPWRQKGTGRARAGSNTSPLWVGGAVAHGPKPRDYTTRVSKRTRRQALASVLSEKVKNKQLIVLDTLNVASGKTRDMVSLLKVLGLGQHSATLIFSTPATAGKSASAECTPTWRSCRNLEQVLPLNVSGVNVYDVLRQSYLVVTQEGVPLLERAVLGVKVGESTR